MFLVSIRVLWSGLRLHNPVLGCLFGGRSKLTFRKHDHPNLLVKCHMHIETHALVASHVDGCTRDYVDTPYGIDLRMSIGV